MSDIDSFGSFDLDTDFGQFLASVIERSTPNLSPAEKRELRETLSQPEFGYVEDFRNARLMSAILATFPKRQRLSIDRAAGILALEARGPMLESARNMGIDLEDILARPGSIEVFSRELSQEVLLGQADALAMAAKSYPIWKKLGSPLVNFELELQSKAVSTLVDHGYPTNPNWKHGGISNAKGIAPMTLKPQTYVFRGRDTQGAKKTDWTKTPVFHGMVSPVGVAF